MDDRFCVYTHSHDGIVFYVGKGRLARPFDKNNRNKAWHAKVNLIRSYEIEIVSWHSVEQEALDHESTLIESLRPECNCTCGSSQAQGNKQWHLPRLTQGCPPDLIEKLNAEASKTGCRVTHVVRQALEQYLNRS